jgi:hypothetical protein
MGGNPSNGLPHRFRVFRFICGDTRSVLMITIKTIFF